MPDHPCPTFARPRWTSLDGEWGFASGRRDDRPLDLAYDATIQVPFPPEAAASGIGQQRCDHPRYRRTFAVDASEGERVLLHFEGVDYVARVWVDGQFVGGHTGGHTPFVLDVTDALGEGPHEVVVAAEDLQDDRHMPRGKQDWADEPHVIWYRRSSGIWRSVWLETVPAVRLASVAWTPLDAAGTVAGEVLLHGDARGGEVECVFTCEGAEVGRVRVPLAGASVRFTAHLRGDLAWSPRRPRLVEVSVRLVNRGRAVDAVASYLGVRTVDTHDAAIRINGEPCFLRLVLEQAFWPDTHFTAPSASAARAEAELIRALGFDGLRLHQTTADPRFLRACDELGLVVWADAPAAMEFSTTSFTRSAAAWPELIARDRNHPCVIAWVPFNESWGVDAAASDPAQRAAIVALQAMAAALDPSRLALGNDGWEHVAGDVVGVHDYSHDPDALRRRYGTREAVAARLGEGSDFGRAYVVGSPDLAGVPVVLSEFGGLSLDADADAWAGYGGVRDGAELVAKLAALVAQVGPDSGLAGFCYTQLTDTLQEQNGLCWPDRTPKAPVADLRAALRANAES